MWLVSLSARCSKQWELSSTDASFRQNAFWSSTYTVVLKQPSPTILMLFLLDLDSKSLHLFCSYSNRAVRWGTSRWRVAISSVHEERLLSISPVVLFSVASYVETELWYDCSSVFTALMSALNPIIFLSRTLLWLNYIADIFTWRCENFTFKSFNGLQYSHVEWCARQRCVMGFCRLSSRVFSLNWC